MHKFVELFQLAERSGVRMPQASVFFTRTFLSVDAIILALAPDFNIPAAVKEFFEVHKEKTLVLQATPDEAPLYMRPEFTGEWAELLRSFDEELKAMDRELLMEQVSGIMERLS